MIYRPPFLLTVDCEGEKYTSANKLTMNQALQNADWAVAFCTEHGFRAALLASPFFVKAASDMGLLGGWMANENVECGLHVHPDDLPDEITAGLGFWRPNELHIASYSYDEQCNLLEKCIQYMQRYEYNPIAFRGGYFSMDDNTARALRQISQTRWQSHNERRKEYRVQTDLLPARPILADPNAKRYSFDEPATCASLCFEDYPLEVLMELVRLHEKGYKGIVGITHSVYLYESTRMKILAFNQWLDGREYE